MSKGKRRNAWAAQAARKRNPDAWFNYPAVSPKAKRKSRNGVAGRTGGDRGRDA
jgi:hypothetical protein